MRKFVCTPALVATLLTPMSTFAAEVDFEGYYRARARGFDSLSIDRELASSEGRSLYLQHRLWLRPRLVVDEHVSVFVDFRGLDGLDWGSAPAAVLDPVTGEVLTVDWNDALDAPPTDASGRTVDFAAWRAWAQIDTRIGRFTFGRTPLHWGLGVWQNDGLSWNGEFGDSADRIAWSNTFEKVYAQLAIDVNTEGFRNATDDTTSFNGAVGYKSETTDAGIQVQLRHSPGRDFNLFTVDGAVQSQIGTIDLGAEVIGQFGSGDLENGVNDVNVASFGGVVQAGAELSKINIQLEGGLASGDPDAADQSLRDFSFDRDFNVGLLLFEQPLPTLAATAPSAENEGRALETALSGNGVRNALYIRPTLGRTLRKGLTVEGTLIAARTFQAPSNAPTRTAYGMEVDARVRWTPTEHLDFGATFATMFPGSFYRNYSDDNFSGFSGTVFGGEMIGQVRF